MVIEHRLLVVVVRLVCCSRQMKLGEIAMITVITGLDEKFNLVKANQDVLGHQNN